MAGHSKWKQIKEKKGKSDAMKSKIFGKFARLITVETKKAGGNLNSPNLKAVIERARKENTPNDVIERAIKKATEAGGQAMESIVYETYGPGGVAIIIEALTDNKNKAVQEIKHILSEQGFELATQGSASWAFKKTNGIWEPTMTIPLSDANLEILGNLTNKLEENDEVQEVFTNAE